MTGDQASDFCIGTFIATGQLMKIRLSLRKTPSIAQSWFRQKVPPARRWAVFRACRVALVLCVAAAAAFVPGFGFFISLIGSLACSVLSFVIPALSHLALFRDTMPRRLFFVPRPCLPLECGQMAGVSFLALCQHPELGEGFTTGRTMTSRHITRDPVDVATHVDTARAVV
jgi:hypothetical protein